MHWLFLSVNSQQWTHSAFIFLSRTGGKSAISHLETDLCLKRVAATLWFQGSWYQGAIFKELKADAVLWVNSEKLCPYLSNDKAINMLVILLCCEDLFFSVIVEFLGFHKFVPGKLKQKFFLFYKKEIRRVENVR